jgi:hypothetical protein
MLLVFKVFLFQLSLLIYSSKLSINLTCLKLFLRFFLNKDVECLDENISQNNQTQNILNYENIDSNRDELVILKLTLVKQHLRMTSFRLVLIARLVRLIKNFIFILNIVHLHFRKTHRFTCGMV